MQPGNFIPDMNLSRIRAALLAALMAGTAACSGGFQVKNYPVAESLYSAGLAQYNKGRWDNAIAAFEKLTIELPARDTLLSRSHYYLGKAQQRRKQHLLAAQSFTRLTESFPDDTLADDALMEAGDSYAKLWRKPALDPQYGHTALATYRTLLSLYPNSALRPDIERRVVRLEQLMATKDYETGMYYLRRKFYDPAVLYFKDVIRKYPDSGRARDSYIRLVQAYRAIKYRDDLKETCDLARERYPGDAEFNSLCPAATATPVAADSARAVP